jgi:hypothetical protein
MVDRLRAYRRWQASPSRSAPAGVSRGARAPSSGSRPGSDRAGLASRRLARHVRARPGADRLLRRADAALRRCFTAGNRSGARVLREQLAPSGRAALAAAALLAMLNTIPYRRSEDPGKPPSHPCSIGHSDSGRTGALLRSCLSTRRRPIAPPSAEIAAAPKRSRPDVHLDSGRPCRSIWRSKENESRPEVSAVLAFLNPPRQEPARRPAGRGGRGGSPVPARR